MVSLQAFDCFFQKLKKKSTVKAAFENGLIKTDEIYFVLLIFYMEDYEVLYLQVEVPKGLQKS